MAMPMPADPRNPIDLAHRITDAAALGDLNRKMAIAAAFGDPKAIELILAIEGFHIHSPDDMLDLAAVNGRLDCAKLLLSPRVAVSPDGISRALSSAAGEGHEDCVQLLMGHCGKQFLAESGALISAASNGRAECVRLLIGASNPKANSSAALVAAASNGHAECVRLLIPASDPLADDSRSLSFAALKGHAECVALLIPVSNPKALDSEALGWSVAHPECVRLLAPVSDPSAHNFNALRCAAESGYLESVEILLANAPAKAIEASIVVAAKKGHAGVVFYLLSREASCACDLAPALIAAQNAQHADIEAGLTAIIEMRALNESLSPAAHAPLSMRL